MTDHDIKNAPINELLEVANEVVDDIVSRSRIFDPASELGLPRFEERGTCQPIDCGRAGCNPSCANDSHLLYLFHHLNRARCWKNHWKRRLLCCQGDYENQIP